ncbi:hypothetical protein P7H62_04410 [Vagococcus carniphilus]|uniref:hypothetical protein n=1 Tax=Vagococcus carniphilus TaxID=218144 RepID=UPI00288F8F96|nr:hypothetical protein [Vagococcus carniphilus]MDT2830947.1 hypothetical protein [Vagococcus carniphilus]MDT2838156.1 hypothetical protein [Vagococcus carniphilus]MDT2853683.1 hypothetical protein [Vagococcus carniphilus]
MKICILSASNIRHMSLISLYTSVLDKNNIAYDIVYMDKYGIDELISAENKHKVYIPIDRDWGKLKKITQYLKFRKKAKTIISNNYDFIIVWGTHTAFLFFDFLLIRYRKKYCLNIRDYFGESRKLIYFLHKKLIKSASFSTISSEGFLSFLPEHTYQNIHSLNETLNSMQCDFHRIRKEQPVVITFIGYVRFFENDKKLIDELGNDDRFILKFIGEGSQYLKVYVESKKINNVICIDSFSVENTAKYLEDTDVINNLYGKNNIALDTAVSIKFYYSLMKKIPILTFKDTFISNLSEELEIAIAIDGIEGSADKIFKKYQSMNSQAIAENCDRYLKQVRQENNQFGIFLAEKIFVK